MNKKFTLFLLVVLAKGLDAQTVSDALRYSESRVMGSAAGSGLSGAVGALGGDVTAIGINPAGIGVYKNSYITTGLSFSKNFVRMKLDNEQNSNSSFLTDYGSLKFDQIFLVINTNPIASKWRQVNLTFGLQRIASYSRDSYFYGKSQGSIVDRFLENALDPNGVDFKGINPDLLDDFESGLAYNTGAIYDPTPNNGKIEYVHDLLSYRQYSIVKNQNISELGGMYEAHFGLGSNFKDWLYLGGALGVPYGKYISNKLYKENNPTANEYKPFVGLEFEEKLTSKLNGINASIGVIAKIKKSLRLGLAFKSPTIFNVEEAFKTSLTYKFIDSSGIQIYSDQSPDGEFNYSLQTPYTVTGSAALVVPFGIISFDADLIDYKTMRFNFNSENTSGADLEYQTQLNNTIDLQYKRVVNLRAGTEIKFSDHFKCRGGFHWIQSPYADSKSRFLNYSLGMGFRGRKVFLDLATVYQQQESSYAPYITGSSDFDDNGTTDAVTPRVQSTFSRWFFQASLGFKF